MLKQSSFKLSETILNVVISMEQKICDKNINITGLESLTENYICGDQDLLHQVVYNLVDNAVKFTPLEGNIDFSLLRVKDNIEFVAVETIDDLLPQALVSMPSSNSDKSGIYNVRKANSCKNTVIHN
jgi:signal transduction histidine kinase